MKRRPMASLVARPGAVPMEQQIDRWDRLPWTQRVECESGFTPARPLSDDIETPDSGLRIGEELNFHDDR